MTCRESEKQNIEDHQRPPRDVDEFRRDWAERGVDARRKCSGSKNMSSEAFYPVKTQKKQVRRLEIAIGSFINVVVFLLGERGGESLDFAGEERKQ
jgi:hypothetical protein